VRSLIIFVLVSGAGLGWNVLRARIQRDAGLAELGALTSLTQLWLDGTKVTDQGLKTLAAFKSLRALHIGGAGVSEAGLASFRMARPDVRINLEPAPMMKELQR
jgi:hypothetical protein